MKIFNIFIQKYNESFYVMIINRRETKYNLIRENIKYPININIKISICLYY